MNFRLLGVCALALGSGLGGRAQVAVAAPAPVLTWTITPGVVTNYMFRGTQLSGPAFQPAAEVGWGNFAGGVWASVPLDNTVPGVSDPEYDVFGSYTWTVSDSLSVVAGGTWYVMPRADRAAGLYRQTWEGNLGLNLTLAGVRLTPKVYYDTVLEAATAELAAAYAVPLQQLGTEVVFTATVGTFKADNAAENASPAVRNWGDYWSAGISVPFQITANGKVIAGFGYHRGAGNFTQQGGAPKQRNPAAIGRGVVSLAYALSF
jgi:hypothetical protein